jgi:opacity protein-like surface antigen
MKKLLMMLVMATVAMTASAQNTLRDKGSFTLQPKAGVGIGTISGNWTTVGGEKDKARIGFVAGLEGEYYAADWFGLAVGLNYAQQGFKFEAEDYKETTKLDYLNVPIVGNFYVAKGLALKTGFQFGFLMNAKLDSQDIKDLCNKVNFAIPIGVSYEIENVVLDLRYNLGLNKTNKADNGNKARTDLIQITLGYKFNL